MCTADRLYYAVLLNWSLVPQFWSCRSISSQAGTFFYMDFPFSNNDIDELVAAINSPRKPLHLGDQRRQHGAESNGEQDPILEFLHVQDPESQTPRLVSLPTAAELASVDLAHHCEYQFDFTSSMELTLPHGMQSQFSLESMGALPSAESHPTYSSSRVPSTDTNSFTVPGSRNSSHFELLRDLFYPQENVPVGTMFMYPNDGTESWMFCGQLHIGYFDAAVQLRKTKQTVDREFQTLCNFKKGLRSKSKHIDNQFHSVPSWRPVSLYVAAFTNVKPPIKLNAQYFVSVPYTSCFGRINMRIKRAWKRRRKGTIVQMKPLTR